MNDYLGQNQFFFEADIFADQICFFYERYLTSFTFTWIRGFQNLLGFLIFHSLQSKTFDFSKENGTCLNKKKLLKGVHPIIFVLNIFPNLHLIQKYIHNQQLFWNSCWLCICTFLNQMRIGKNIGHKDDRMKSLYKKQYFANSVSSVHTKSDDM